MFRLGSSYGALCALGVWLASLPASAQDGGMEEVPDAASTEPAEIAVDERDACTAERHLVLRAEALSASLAQGVRTDLAAELAARGIAVCERANAVIEPLAQVTLHGHDEAVTLEVEDHMTHKRLSRDVRMDGIPPSGRSLALAIAVDELLRASWAELTLSKPRTEPPAKAPPPPRPAPAPAPPARHMPYRTRSQAITVAGGFTHGMRSWNAFSASVRASFWPWSWAWLELGTSFLQALEVSSPLGSVSARGVGGDITLGVCPFQHARFFGCTGLRTTLDWIAFDANAVSAHVRTRDEAGTALQLDAVGAAGVNLSHHLFVSGQLSLGAPALGISAGDGKSAVLGLSGWTWTGSIGLGVQR